MHRRSFLAATAAAGMQTPSTAAPGRFIGIQVGPHSLLDEGIERSLDLIQSSAAANALLIYSQTYHLSPRPLAVLARDHGINPRDPAKRKLPHLWFRPHDEFYRGTALRHQKVDGSYEYHDRDVFEEVAEPARKRGIRVYARILEASGREAARAIENWPRILSQDVHGRPTLLPCWNNPDYQAWWMATAEDLFRHYPIDGLQWGAERVGPLSLVLYRGAMPVCFCGYCRERGRDRGVDVERARTGFKLLHEYVSALMRGEAAPPGGVMTGALRYLLQYPEILQWEQQWRQSKEELAQKIYGAVKAVRPNAQVGRHIDHQQSSWDMIYRSQLSYGDMAPYSDFIKFIAYHDILGPRIRWWYLERLRQGVLRELSLEQSLSLYYAFFGYDPKSEATVAELEKGGFCAEYVFRETKRCVEELAGKAAVYAGIGFDVPFWKEEGMQPFPSDPGKLTLAVKRAFDAGANGIVISREYDEMRLPNLRAIGRGLRL
ncbi:MAG: hypothetical protein SFV54_08860 [Bryobacteraceae bacterium]|nr:hypothetical protein [Bryobacteraceae bacterium]